MYRAIHRCQAAASFLGMLGSSSVKSIKEYAVPAFDDVGVRIIWTSKRDLVLIGKGHTEFKFSA